MKGIPWYRVAVVALAAAVAQPVVAVAQGGVPSPLTATAFAAPMQPSAPLVGPLMVQSGVTRAVAAPPAMASMQHAASRRDVSWMIVGGAAVIVGSIVGGDGGTIIMVTGGVIGLVGLWRYLQYS